MATPYTEGTDAKARPLGDYTWYLAGQGSWFASFGLQAAIFPWIVAVVLHESPIRVGFAQTALLAPALLLMIYGGAFADRTDTRKLLVTLHSLAALAPLTLGLATLFDLLSFKLVIAFGLVMGTVTAFVMPARDSLLSTVAADALGGNLQKAVTLAALMQFVGQLVGILGAGVAAFIGMFAPAFVPILTPLLLVFQSAVLASGAAVTTKLKPAPPHGSDTGAKRAHVLSEMRDGVMEVFRSPVLLPMTAAMFGVGIFFVGSFLVLLPLIARDYYGGSEAEIAVRIAAINLCFTGGTLIAIFTMLRIGHVERRGIVLLLALTNGAVFLALMSIPMPFEVMCLACVFWGIGAGISITMSRTIVQAAAVPSHRARILSVFQMGFTGGAPIGSLIAGFLVEALGPHNAALVPAAGMGCLLLVLTFFSRVRHIVEPAPHSGP